MDRDTEMPPVNVRRWTVRRKAAVVHAVRNGLLSVEDAATRYRLSQEELQSWERDLDRHGLYGLRAKRVQAYRRLSALDRAHVCVGIVLATTASHALADRPWPHRRRACDQSAVAALAAFHFST